MMWNMTCVSNYGLSLSSLGNLYFIHLRDVLQGTPALTSREHFVPLHPRSGNVLQHRIAHPRSSLWSLCTCGSGHRCTLCIVRNIYRNSYFKCLNKKTKRKNKVLYGVVRLKNPLFMLPVLIRSTMWCWTHSCLPPTMRCVFGKRHLACMRALAWPEWKTSKMPSAYTRTGLSAGWRDKMCRDKRLILHRVLLKLFFFCLTVLNTR